MGCLSSCHLNLKYQDPGEIKKCRVEVAKIIYMKG